MRTSLISSLSELVRGGDDQLELTRQAFADTDYQGTKEVLEEEEAPKGSASDASLPTKGILKKGTAAGVPSTRFVSFVA